MELEDVAYDLRHGVVTPIRKPLTKEEQEELEQARQKHPSNKDKT